MIVRKMYADFSSVQNGLAGARLNCGHFPKELIDALKGMELSRSIPCLLFFQCRNLILTYGEKYRIIHWEILLWLTWLRVPPLSCCFLVSRESKVYFFPAWKQNHLQFFTYTTTEIWNKHYSAWNAIKVYSSYHISTCCQHANLADICIHH